MKKINGCLIWLVASAVIAPALAFAVYAHEMAPTWADIAKKEAEHNLKQAEANAQIDIETHAIMSMAWGAGSWVLVFSVVAVVGVFVWKEYDKRQESKNRAVDGTFPTTTIHHNGRTVLLDPNKSQFGFIAYDKKTGEIATDATVTGPDRQLEYAGKVQATRTAAARQLTDIRNSAQAKYAAGYYDREPKRVERQPDPIAPPSRQLTMWTARDAFKHNTDTTFAIGLTDASEIIRWDVESTPHVRVHGKTQGSGKTNLIKEIVTGAVLSGAHVIVLDRRGFKDWAAFQPFVELVDNRISGAFYGTVKRIQEIYRERDGLLGGAGVGNLASLTDAPKRIFLIISEFGSACRDALASGELDHVVPLLKNILSEAGATGVHLIFEDQAINRNWPPELRGNAEPITGYLPQDASKAGGYTKAFELERYQFHYDGDRFRTFDMSVEAPVLLFDAPIVRDEDCLIDTSSFLPSFQENDFSGKNGRKINFSEEGRKEEPSATELQRMIWEWRQYNPDGRQAELIRHFAASGITVTSGYVSKIWNRQEED